VTRTLTVACDAIPGLDDGQMRRLALAEVFSETEPPVSEYLHTEGVERYCAALQRISADISDQLAAHAAGRFDRADPAWSARAGKLKERIDRLLPDVKAQRTAWRQQANGGDHTRQLRELVAAVEAHRGSLAGPGSDGSDGITDADLALWAELDRITGQQ
jgi:hypothetical protein